MIYLHVIPLTFLYLESYTDRLHTVWTGLEYCEAYNTPVSMSHHAIKTKQQESSEKKDVNSKDKELYFKIIH